MAVSSGLLQAVNFNLGAGDLYWGTVFGGDWDADANLRRVDGISGKQWLKGGMVEPGLRFDMYPTVSTMFSATGGYLWRNKVAAGYPYVLPAVITGVEGGDNNDEYQLTDAITNSVVIELQREGDLTLRGWELLSLLPNETGSAITGAAAAGALYPWTDGSLLIEGAPGEVQTVQIEIRSNLQLLTSLDTKVAGKERWPEKLVVGNEEVIVRVEPFDELTASLWAKALPADSTIALTAANGVDTITVSVEAAGTAKRRPFQAGDRVITKGFEFNTAVNSQCLTCTVV